MAAMVYSRESELQLFLRGHKPALFSEDYQMQTMEDLGYPTSNVLQLVFKPGKEVKFSAGPLISFQHKKLLDMFLKQQMHVISNAIKNNLNEKEWLKEYHLLIGKTLGFPPMAVEYFASIERDINDNGRIFIDYCGLHFVDHIDNFDETMRWLQKQYKLPKSYEYIIRVEANRGQRKVYHFERDKIANPFI